MTKFCTAFAGPTMRNPLWALCGGLVGALMMLAASIYGREVEIATAVAALRTAELASRGPVVIVESTVQAFDAEGVNIHLGPGEKLRDCEYRGTQAFFATPDEAGMRELIAKRIDAPEVLATRPVGQFLTFGLWRLTPRAVGKARLLMFINYECNGTIVVTRVADLNNPQ